MEELEKNQEKIQKDLTGLANNRIQSNEIYLSKFSQICI
jgi:hypothetical protein